MTFLEFGHALIHDSDFWIKFAVITTEDVKRVRGHASGVMKLLCRAIFGMFSRDGVAIDIRGRPTMFFATVSNFLLDGAELSNVFDTLSFSASKCCPNCINAVSASTFDATEDSGQFVPITETSMRRFTLHTDRSIWRAIDDLDELKRATKRDGSPLYGPTRFKAIEQSYGYRWNPDGFLAAKDLRPLLKPCRLMTHDWAHIFGQNGVGNVDIWHIIRHAGIDTGLLVAEMKSWTWPAHHAKVGKQSWQVFAPRRAASSRSASYWKSSVSEFMTVLPVLLNFFRMNATSATVSQISSLEQLCSLLDVIMKLKRGEFDALHTFAALLQTWFVHTIRTYGNDITIPKHHVAVKHLPPQFERDGIVIDTLACERAHKIPLGFAHNIQNRTTHDKSVILRVVAHQRKALAEFDERPGLRGPTSSEEGGLTISKAAYFHGLHLSAGDFMVSNGNEIVKVQACGMLHGSLFVFVNNCDVLQQHDHGRVLLRCRDDFATLWMRDARLLHAKCWRALADGRFEALLPMRQGL